MICLGRARALITRFSQLRAHLKQANFEIAFTDASRIFTFSPTAVFTVTVFLLLILLGTVHMDYADFSF